MNKVLTSIADKLIKEEYADCPCYICEEEGYEILQYIYDKTHKVYYLQLDEEDYGSDIKYSCHISEANEMSVTVEYWPCYAR